MKKILLMFMTVYLSGMSGVALSQTREEILKDFMEQRKKMMESMMDLMNDSFEQDFFDMDDSFGRLQGFKGVGNNVSVEEKYEQDGTISILIKPENENVNLDIKTSEDRITIKSEIREEVKNEKSGTTSSQFSMSSSTKSIGIPKGYSAGSPEAIDGMVKISLKPSKELKKAAPEKNRSLLKDNPDLI